MDTPEPSPIVGRSLDEEEAWRLQQLNRELCRIFASYGFDVRTCEASVYEWPGGLGQPPQRMLDFVEQSGESIVRYPAEGFVSDEPNMILDRLEGGVWSLKFRP